MFTEVLSSRNLILICNSVGDDESPLSLSLYRILGHEYFRLLPQVESILSPHFVKSQPDGPTLFRPTLVIDVLRQEQMLQYERHLPRRVVPKEDLTVTRMLDRGPDR